MTDLLDGKGARETRIVWGPFRDIPHAYRQDVYAKTITWITLCGRALTPRGGVVGPQPKHLDRACLVCRQALGLAPESGLKKSR